MFTTNRIPVIILVVFVISAGWFFFFRGSDESAIRGQLDKLVEVVEKDAPVSTFEALSRSRKLTKIFAKKTHIEYYQARQLSGDSDAIASAFLSVWGQIDKVSIRVIRHTVEVAASGREAESIFKATCNVVMNGSEKMGDTREYRVNWIKVEGDWLIEQIVPILSGK